MRNLRVYLALLVTGLFLFSSCSSYSIVRNIYQCQSWIRRQKYGDMGGTSRCRLGFLFWNSCAGSASRISNEIIWAGSGLCWRTYGHENMVTAKRAIGKILVPRVDC